MSRCRGVSGVVSGLALSRGPQPLDLSTINLVVIRGVEECQPRRATPRRAILYTRPDYKKTTFNGATTLDIFGRLLLYKVDRWHNVQEALRSRLRPPDRRCDGPLLLGRHGRLSQARVSVGYLPLPGLHRRGAFAPGERRVSGAVAQTLEDRLLLCLGGQKALKSATLDAGGASTRGSEGLSQ